jgi:hypothetical protein
MTTNAIAAKAFELIGKDPDVDLFGILVQAVNTGAISASTALYAVSEATPDESAFNNPWGFTTHDHNVMCDLIKSRYGKVPAIKYARETYKSRTGETMGLRETKDWIEEVFATELNHVRDLIDAGE